jgi:ATP-binding cassette subfamily G (WHITE) protein 2 (PDR)
MPYKTLNAITSNIPLYFLTKLRREPGPFFFFIFTSFCTTLTMSMLFRTIGATSRSMAQAMAPTAIILLSIMTYTGFVVPQAYILGWSKWIFYINPVAYSFESLMLNEFWGKSFDCSQYFPDGVNYDNVSGLGRVCSAVGSSPGLDFVLGSTYLKTAYKYDISHKWR